MVTSPYHTRHILSIAQDIIFCATNGSKPPKPLPVTVHHLTGSTLLVKLQLLKCFGHGISILQHQRLQTAITDEQLARNSQFSSDIVTNVPAMFCWDNNNIVEKTRTGAGTTHCINGIVIQ